MSDNNTSKIGEIHETEKSKLTGEHYKQIIYGLIAIAGLSVIGVIIMSFTCAADGYVTAMVALGSVAVGALGGTIAREKLGD